MENQFEDSIDMFLDQNKEKKVRKFFEQKVIVSRGEEGEFEAGDPKKN